MKLKNVYEIISDYLATNGFDGLHNGAECGCLLDDLNPCGDMTSSCSAGYKIDVPDDVECEFDYYICDNKDEKPWQK